MLKVKHTSMDFFLFLVLVGLKKNTGKFIELYTPVNSKTKDVEWSSGNPLVFLYFLKECVVDKTAVTRFSL